MNDNISTDEEEWLSKTQRKQACDNMQKLGEALMTLKSAELDEFNLPDILHNALQEAHKIRQRGALKRHRQYIGKIMRDMDIDNIQKQYDHFCHKDDINNAHFKRLEKWRERILSEGDKALNELVSEYPQIDRQHLRQLIRKAHKEQENNKPPATFRVIFKYLRDSTEDQ